VSFLFSDGYSPSWGAACFCGIFLCCGDYQVLKKLVRKHGSGEYLQANGSWTGNLDEAWITENVNAALCIVHINKLSDVDLVYLMGDKPGKNDLYFPLPRSRK
jgi:hypothetical protein